MEEFADCPRFDARLAISQVKQRDLDRFQAITLAPLGLLLNVDLLVHRLEIAIETAPSLSLLGLIVRQMRLIKGMPVLLLLLHLFFHKLDLGENLVQLVLVDVLIDTRV